MKTLSAVRKSCLIMKHISKTDPCLCFLRYDEEHSADDKVFLDCFCKIAAGIKNNSNGHQLKDLILQKGITQSALDYMKKHIPNAKKYVSYRFKCSKIVHQNR